MTKRPNDAKTAKKDHSTAVSVAALVAGAASWFLPWMWYGAAAGILAVILGTKGSRSGNRRGLSITGVMLAVGAAVYTLFALRGRPG